MAIWGALVGHRVQFCVYNMSKNIPNCGILSSKHNQFSESRTEPNFDHSHS